MISENSNLSSQDIDAWRESKLKKFHPHEVGAGMSGLFYRIQAGLSYFVGAVSDLRPNRVKPILEKIIRFRPLFTKAYKRCVQTTNEVSLLSRSQIGWRLLVKDKVLISGEGNVKMVFRYRFNTKFLSLRLLK